MILGETGLVDAARGTGSEATVEASDPVDASISSGLGINSVCSGGFGWALGFTVLTNASSSTVVS